MLSLPNDLHICCYDSFEWARMREKERNSKIITLIAIITERLHIFHFSNKLDGDGTRELLIGTLAGNQTKAHNEMWTKMKKTISFPKPRWRFQIKCIAFQMCWILIRCAHCWIVTWDRLAIPCPTSTTTATTGQDGKNDSFFWVSFDKYDWKPKSELKRATNVHTKGACVCVCVYVPLGSGL